MQQQQQQSMMGGAPPLPPPQQPIYPMDQSSHLPPSQQAALQQPYIQPRIGRLPADRPLVKLSVSLIDTYKQINTVYYEERDARRAARAKEKSKKGQGTNNNGWDDEHYDYIITAGELFYGRYRIKERIGKGSFGQVVRAEDTQEGKDVAIKIIKSKKPFLMQAKTEIDLLTHLNEKDPDDQHNIGT
jgi:dual specificity tyrosine-phosphorylation-regulated kinase 1